MPNLIISLLQLVHFSLLFSLSKFCPESEDQSTAETSRLLLQLSHFVLKDHHLANPICMYMCINFLHALHMQSLYLKWLVFCTCKFHSFTAVLSTIIAVMLRFSLNGILFFLIAFFHSLRRRIRNS